MLTWHNIKSMNYGIFQYIDELWGILIHQWIMVYSCISMIMLVPFVFLAKPNGGTP
jgi:hypothetical protein